MLLRLRLLHPIIAVGTSILLILWSGTLKAKLADPGRSARWANLLSLLLLAEIAFGSLTLLTLAPILMQLGHLLLADAIWIVFVLLSLEILAAPAAYPQPETFQFAPSETIVSSDS